MMELGRFVLVRFLVIVGIVLVVVLLASGCATSQQAVRRAGDAVEVRLPADETVDVRLMKEPVPPAPASAPFSVLDEYRGRWLTLFELDLAPSETGRVPAPPPESP